MKKGLIFPMCILFVFGIFGTSYAGEFQNGSFEEGPPEIGSFIPLNSGETAIPGWKIINGSIDLKGDYWEASDGDRSIDLNGNEPGAISQTFDTQAGAFYQVLFDMAGNPNTQELKVLLVNVNSTVTQYEFDNTGKTKDTMGWIEMSFFFQANSDSTTLQFSSANPGSASGPALDNVRVLHTRTFPQELIHPTGAVHAYDNLLWPPNNKLVPVAIEGYVLDELSMIRDGEGIGVFKAYLVVDGEEIILRNDTKDLLEADGSFRIMKNLEAKKGAIYPIELWASNTNAIEDGESYEYLVDSTSVRVPHDMTGNRVVNANALGNDEPHGNFVDPTSPQAPHDMSGKNKPGKNKPNKKK